MPFRFSRFAGWLGALMLLLALASVSVETVGLFEDEGIYEATAHSLVEGRGYRIDSLPGEPPNAKYPFAYPFWIAVQKILLPGHGLFEQAVLKLSNLVLLLALVWIFYRTLRDRFAWSREASQAAAAFLGLCAPVLAFSTMMMSEIPFALALWFLIREICAEETMPSRRTLSLVLVAGILAYYLRTVAVVILAAAVCDLFLHNQKKHAAALAAGWAIAVAPWIAWSKNTLSEFSMRSPVLAKLLAYHLSYDFHVAALTGVANQEGWLAAAQFEGWIIFNNACSLLEALGDFVFPIGFIYAGLLAVPPGFLSWLSMLSGAAVVVAAFLGYRATHLPAKRFLGMLLAGYAGLLIVWPWPLGGRFLIPIVPVFVVLVGEYLRRWPESWSAGRRLAIVVCLLLHLVATLTVIPGGTLWTRFLFPSPPPAQQEVVWMKNHVGTEDVVFAGLSSQWLSREIEHPIVGYNTLLPPSSALRLHFHMNRAVGSDVDEFGRGLAEWNGLIQPRKGRVFILSDLSLNGRSRRSLDQLERAARLQLVFEKTEPPVKIFRYIP